MNNTQKIISAILGLGVAVGLGFVAIKSNDKAIRDGNEQPIEIPETSTEPLKKPAENPTVPPTGTYSEFGKAVTLKLNEKITFSDGLTIVLKAINDSRCPKDVQCIWAGELALFMVSSGKLSSSKEIYLGINGGLNHSSKSLTLEDYIFSIKNATENNITIVVEYKKSTVPTVTCFVGGCSGQICSDQKDIVSTCEYREEYACYKTAKCEKQTSGQCGWTQTPALKECLANGNAGIIY